jgi:hypothetical protein
VPPDALGDNPEVEREVFSGAFFFFFFFSRPEEDWIELERGGR